MRFYGDCGVVRVLKIILYVDGDIIRIIFY